MTLHKCFTIFCFPFFSDEHHIYYQPAHSLSQQFKNFIVKLQSHTLLTSNNTSFPLMSKLFVSENAYFRGQYEIHCTKCGFLYI